MKFNDAIMEAGKRGYAIRRADSDLAVIPSDSIRGCVFIKKMKRTPARNVGWNPKIVDFLANDWELCHVKGVINHGKVRYVFPD